jgi:hypothetical protein
MLDTIEVGTIHAAARGRDLETIGRYSGRFQRMVSRIPTYLDDLRADPLWVVMFTAARIEALRNLHWRFTATPEPPPAFETMFPGVDCSETVAQLRQDGIALGLALPDAVVDEITAFASSQICYGNLDRALAFRPMEHARAEARCGRPIVSGHYFERTLLCPAIRRLQGDALLLAVARRYLGRSARVSSTRLWWSFPSGAPAHVGRTAAGHASGRQDESVRRARYHFDLDDWRMLKFFFYLTDVEEPSGPHVFVRASHRRHALRHQFTLFVGHSAESVLSAYGEANALVVTGPRGTGFVEDSYGFHMGAVPRCEPRLMLEIGFGVSSPSPRRFFGEPVLHRR